MVKLTNIFWLFIATSTLFISCNGCNNNDEIVVENNDDTSAIQVKVNVPIFNEDSAYYFVKKQCDFGPRVPNTLAHKECAKYFEKYFKALADTVFIQETNVTTWDKKELKIKNFIASFNPKNTNRILLSSHWDSRPIADNDITRKNEAIIGANDGASGVGILMEIAKKIKLQQPSIGIDIILFDAEDWGNGDFENSFCLGSQYWTKNVHITNYKPIYGILLDMVGAPNATFPLEAISKQKAGYVQQKIWGTAQNLGYGSNFISIDAGAITDDHAYIINNLGIPMVDIIHLQLSGNNTFGDYWHTHKDNIDAIDKKTLKAVGQTLLQVIYNE